MTFRDGTKGRRERVGARAIGGDARTSGAHYRELLPIGSGGSANITIAIAEGVAGFSKLVVLKTIREELVANAAATNMFLDEARLSARMNHPNVVQVYEVFLRKGLPVIVMEFLDGQPLSSILAQAPDSRTLSQELGISILSKVLAGLHYAHTLSDFSGQPLGLIHRDVSPHNVMVTYDGQVKLVDFGIAKLAGAEHQTRTGVIKGKLTYMAPEQFTGKVDCRGDIFGVGVMLWELATRKRFWGDLPEPALIGRLISGDLPHIGKQSLVEDDLYKICAKALAFMPDDRYESAAAMQEDLERYLVKRGAVVTPAVVGKLVMETCAEARRKVQSGIREQLSQHGLSLTGSMDGLTPDKVRSKSAMRETLSGERLRQRPGMRDPLRRTGTDETTTGALRRKAAGELTNTGGFRTNAELSTGGLRKKAAAEQTITGNNTAADAHTVFGEGLVPDVVVDAPAANTPGDQAVSTDATPLRLFGGVAPTARAGVALAGFGTLGVLILALGLATPDDPSKIPQPVPVAPAVQPPPVQKATSVRISASAQPEEAAWYLDDQKLDNNPVDVTVPTDGAVHTLRAEAKGHKPFIKSVRFEHDIDITVALTRD